MIAPRPRLTAALLGLVIAGALEAPSKRFAWVTIANDSARYKGCQSHGDRALFIAAPIRDASRQFSSLRRDVEVDLGAHFARGVMSRSTSPLLHALLFLTGTCLSLIHISEPTRPY